jgi:energy-coupling factor transporter ATP-binding protein EcfA2
MAAEKLIIIRGNSGSGKSTVAKQLRYALGYGTMLVPQDVIRKDILRVKDIPGNTSVELIRRLAHYGWECGYDVVIEGILHADKAGEMLRQLITDCPGESFVYYFDLPFEETLRRHATKPNAHEFGEELMREWWCEKDFLGVPGERIIDHQQSADETVAMIERDIERSKV